VEGLAGKREVAAAAFFVGPEGDPRRDNVLQPGEVVTHVILPPLPPGWRGVYPKARGRTAGDFALASAAIGYDRVDRRMESVRIVLGGVAPVPMRRPHVESIREGRAPTEELAAQAADVMLQDARPLASNGFKLDL